MRVSVPRRLIPARRVLATACALALMAVASQGVLAAAVSSDPSARVDAEEQRQALVERIERLRKEIAESEKARAAAADALKESEQAISDITRKLSELEARRDEAAADLSKLEQQIAQLDADLQRRQDDLAELVRRQYMSGAVTPWSALLSGDDPQEMGRNLSYLGYISRARAEAVQELRAQRQRLQQLRQDAAARRNELEKLAQEQAAQRTERLRQVAERQRVLEQIGDRLATQRREAERLEDDEARLTRLIAEINRVLAEQAAARRRAEELARRRAEEAAAARAAAERAAAARDAAERAAAEQARKLVEAGSMPGRASAGPDATETRSQEPASTVTRSRFRLRTPAGEASEAGMAGSVQDTRPGTVARVERLHTDPGRSVQAENGRGITQGFGRPQDGSGPVASVTPRTSPTPGSQPAVTNTLQPEPARVNFAALRGRLGLPVQGEIVGRFGAQRPEGGIWRGVFIRAAAESPVRAVAPGAVVFSGWMRGFGNLLILDHGNDYLTVYANNEAILKQVGEPVAAGETVASVGSSGGQSQTGIYFEVRHRGNPVDPLEWVRVR